MPDPDKTNGRPPRPPRPQLPTREELTDAGAHARCQTTEEELKEEKKKRKEEKQKKTNSDAQLKARVEKLESSKAYYLKETPRLRKEIVALEVSAEELRSQNQTLRADKRRLEGEKQALVDVAAAAEAPAKRLAVQRAALSASTAALNAKVKAREDRASDLEKEMKERECGVGRKEKNLDRRLSLLEQREDAVRGIEDACAAAQKDRDAQVHQNGQLVKKLATCRAHVIAKEKNIAMLRVYKAEAKALLEANADALTTKDKQRNTAAQKLVASGRIAAASRFASGELKRTLSESDCELKNLRAQLKEAKARLEGCQCELDKVIEQLQSRRKLLTTRGEDSTIFTTAMLRYVRNLWRAGVPAAHHADVFRASEDFFDRTMSAHPSKATSQREANIAQVWELGHSAHILDVFRLNVKKNGNELIGRYKHYALSDSTLHYCTAPR